MFHAATISKPELEALRSIKKIIRMGRVSALEADKIILDEGVLATSPHYARRLLRKPVAHYAADEACLSLKPT